MFKHRSFLPFCFLLFAAWTAAAGEAPVAVVPAKLAGARQPQVAVAPGGQIHVTFGLGETIYHVCSGDGGRSFSAPVRIGTLPQLALGLRRGPRIVAGARALTVSAISLKDGDLHAWISPDEGATWRETKPINDKPRAAREGLHALAGDGAGHLCAAWLDLRQPGTELWAATSADGGATWSANARVYQSPDGHICECCHPSLAMDAQGRVAIMWRNWLGGARDLYTARSDDFGQTFSSVQKLGTGSWPLNACPMDGGSMAFAPTGALLTAWRREKAVFATGPNEPEQKIASEATQPLVVGDSQGAVRLWEQGGRLMVQNGSEPPAALAEKAHFAAAAPLPSGGTVVVWESTATTRPTLLCTVLR